MAPSTPYYAKDEKVLCFHVDLLYEAKVLDTKPIDTGDKKNGWQYKVHYKGWKKTWDDWVPQDRMRKLTEENKELAASLRREMEALRAKGPPHSTKKAARDAANSARASEDRHSSVTTAPARGQKRNRDYDIEREDAYNSRPSVRIFIPDRLKALLVDDWENITKHLQLVQLPSATPASRILDEYLAQEKQKRRAGSADEDLLEEVVQGLKEYFNRSLGRILLYRFEREQYLQLYTRMESGTDDLAGKTPADIYGGEHLLRLLVSMPELVAQTNMDHQAVGRLREELSKLTIWLAKEENVQKYFAVEYENAGPEYADRLKE
ncbi:MRG-domain-containing protein [Lineolata rhizophorae]|uniref:Chromatin modification-related protein EAF3 n=1 Tax=Lineolata rhizophorae TaxID=578093 RepID=A0A6A6P9T2_9PEZI|nr:MRG-domain-containing protein [Lineolata rhizophorae]